jgi:hypothetical protein
MLGTSFNVGDKTRLVRTQTKKVPVTGLFKLLAQNSKNFLSFLGQNLFHEVRGYNFLLERVSTSLF